LENPSLVIFQGSFWEKRLLSRKCGYPAHGKTSSNPKGTAPVNRYTERRWADRAFILRHVWMCMGKSTMLFASENSIHSKFVEDVYFHMVGMISIN